MYKKNTKRINNPKLIIFCKDGKPFEQWAINVIGPMPHNLYEKHFIITAIDYCTCWPVSCATKVHDGKAIRMFIGSEIISKFGTPKILITDCGRKFISHNI